ncbi:MAG TPA: FAD-binding protein, partial [Ktedonobacterales bacterium]|nr:FAD-binding protein [Ktedonobacterales bacterium]
MTAKLPPETAPVRHLSADERARFAERLAHELGAAQTLTGPACDVFALHGRAPALVVRPADATGVATTLALAAEAGAAVVPWGGGTRQMLGYPPSRYDLALSLERLAQIVHYDPADLTITVGAGMTHSTLSLALADARQTLPLDVPLPEQATLGGTLATNGVGVRRAFAGGPRDLTLGLRLVDARGESLAFGGRVVKNVSGYDMAKLHIGALGTLGVIVEASFKLTPLPEQEATVIGVCAQPEQALAAAESLGALATRPSAVIALHVAALPSLAQLAPGHGRRILVATRIPGHATAVARGVREAMVEMRRAGVEPLLTLDNDIQQGFWATVTEFLNPATSIEEELSPMRPVTTEVVLRLTTLPGSVVNALAMAELLATEQRLTLTWLADMASGALWLRLRAGESLGEAETRALQIVCAELIARWRHVVTLAYPETLL